ncbi:Os04g0355700 [Oryza sativa Japonica Group]|mgnify:CR=1 FL=1|uniref:Os04g0355700 protein n=1 Tax=Oryza sativa subsp. japonica TaxID=39947 RepID=A0A0N7KIW4_ORYSJ|nr:Os04g0355700 [Oryza sativa Japonica Group]
MVVAQTSVVSATEGVTGIVCLVTSRYGETSYRGGLRAPAGSAPHLLHCMSSPPCLCLIDAESSKARKRGSLNPAPYHHSPPKEVDLETSKMTKRRRR